MVNFLTTQVGLNPLQELPLDLSQPEELALDISAWGLVLNLGQYVKYTNTCYLDHDLYLIGHGIYAS